MTVSSSFLVCSQNIPQLSLNIWFMAMFGFHEVALVSAIFSTISLVAMIMAIGTRRDIHLNRQCVLVQFNVLGLSAKDRKLQTKIRGIVHDIASLLSIHPNLIHIEQPRGFRIKMYLYINYVQYKDVNYKQLMEDAVNGGKLAEIFRNQWKLQKVPAIAHLKYEEIQSKFQSMNMVDIFVPKRADPRQIQPQSQVNADVAPRIVFQEDVEGVLMAGMAPTAGAVIESVGDPQGVFWGRSSTMDSEEGMDTKTAAVNE